MGTAVVLNERQRIFAKQRQDSYTVLILGSGTMVMLFMTTMLLMQFLPNLSRTAQFVLAGLTLAVSSLFWFMGKKDDRWSVLCTLINNVGLGIGFFMLLKVLKQSAEPLDFALGALPGIALLSVFCLLFGRADVMGKKRVRMFGILLFAAAFFAGCAAARRLDGMVYKISIMSILVGFACFLALVVSATDPTRSVHRTMALMSFMVYLLLLVVVIAALYVMSRSDSDSGSSRSSSHRSSDRQRGYSSGRFGGRFIDYWFFSSLLSDPMYQGSYSDESIARGRRRTGRFLLIAVGILVAAFVVLVLVKTLG